MKLRLPVPVKPSTSASALGTKKDAKPSPCSGDVRPPTSVPTSAAAANGKVAKRHLELKDGGAASSVRRKKRTSESGSVASAAGEENGHPKKRRKRMSASDDGETVMDGKVSDGICLKADQTSMTILHTLTFSICAMCMHACIYVYMCVCREVTKQEVYIIIIYIWTCLSCLEVCVWTIRQVAYV